MDLTDSEKRFLACIDELIECAALELVEPKPIDATIPANERDTYYRARFVAQNVALLGILKQRDAFEKKCAKEGKPLDLTHEERARFLRPPVDRWAFG